MTNRRTTRPAGRTGRIRPHVLRRDGVLESPREIPSRGRYQVALAAGWKPIA